MDIARRFEDLPEDYARFDMCAYLGSSMIEALTDEGKQVIVDAHPLSNCGTIGCIAGHIVFWHMLSTDDGIACAAGEYLGLDEYDYRMLFAPDSLPSGGLKEITTQECVRALRNLAWRGKPCWDEIVRHRQPAS